MTFRGWCGSGLTREHRLVALHGASTRRRLPPEAAALGTEEACPTLRSHTTTCRKLVTKESRFESGLHSRFPHVRGGKRSALAFLAPARQASAQQRQ